jgi:hypothetical protein
MKKILLLVLLVFMSSYTQAQVRRDTPADTSFRGFLSEWAGTLNSTEETKMIAQKCKLRAA